MQTCRDGRPYGGKSKGGKPYSHHRIGGTKESTKMSHSGTCEVVRVVVSNTSAVPQWPDHEARFPFKRKRLRFLRFSFTQP